MDEERPKYIRTFTVDARVREIAFVVSVAQYGFPFSRAIKSGGPRPSIVAIDN